MRKILESKIHVSKRPSKEQLELLNAETEKALGEADRTGKSATAIFEQRLAENRDLRNAFLLTESFEEVVNMYLREYLDDKEANED